MIEMGETNPPINPLLQIQIAPSFGYINFGYVTIARFFCQPIDDGFAIYVVYFPTRLDPRLETTTGEELIEKYHKTIDSLLDNYIGHGGVVHHLVEKERHFLP